MGYYAGADWLKSSLKITNMSPLGEDVADLLGELFFGIYHLSNSNLKKVKWGEQSNIDVVLGWHSFATYDYDELTRLVFLAHHRAIRVEIHPHSFKYLRLTFSRRSKRSGVLYLRHPSIDAAVTTFKETVGLPEVQLED